MTHWTHWSSESLHAISKAHENITVKAKLKSRDSYVVTAENCSELADSLKTEVGKRVSFLFPPGFEPGTSRVLGERDNHYTTETPRNTDVSWFGDIH